MRNTTLSKETGYWKGAFSAMASPCEVLMEVDREALARSIVEAVAREAWRIEDKYSRYQRGNIVYRINNASGGTVSIDEETARLLDFADQLFKMSEGLFDITSGVLRQAWTFDGSDHLPDAKQVAAILDSVGWQKVQRENSMISLPEGMEIDLGGLGKEYAVDRCVQIARESTDQSVLVNFGGDLCTTGPRQGGGGWFVGRLVSKKDVSGSFQLYKGAIATSGDANRFLLKDGIRYSHILNPLTGWPVENAPHTISVAAATCIEAGMYSTLAMLQGDQAEAFLKLQGVEYWID
jgi:FAD:protein FMN transferase